MKYMVNKDELQRVAKVLGVVSNPDTSVTLRLGVKDVEDKLLSDARITTVGEQVTVQFTVQKPADWAGEAVQLISPSAQLLSEIELLLTFNSDVYIKVEDDGVAFGVEGKTEVGEATLAEGTEPIKTQNYLVLFDAQADSFTKFAKMGLLYSSETVQTNGIQNAVMSLNTETGSLIGYSTDGVSIAKSEGAVTVKKADPNNPQQAEAQKQIDAALDAFCEAAAGKQSREALKINIPYKAVRHLLSLTEGVKAWTAAVTDKHVIVNAGSVQYCFVQGAVSPVALEQILQVLNAPCATKAAFDNEELAKGVGFINKMASLRKIEKAKSVVKFTVRSTGLTASAGVSDEMTADIKEMEFDGEDRVIGLDGNIIARAMSSLSKGVVNIGFTGKYCILSNGDITAPDKKGQIAVFYVQDVRKAQEEKTETGADDGSAGDDTAEEPADESAED